MADYVRQLPQGSADLARPPSAALRFHIDVPLMLLLMALTGFGLVVLYSASGQNTAAVVRQGQYFVIAFVVMIAAAQVSLVRYQRWAPWFYLLGVGLLVAVIFVGVMRLAALVPVIFFPPNERPTFTAEIEVPKGGAEGMIVASGGRFGGYGFYLLDSKPVFLWNLLDLKRIKWEGPDALAPAEAA